MFSRLVILMIGVLALIAACAPVGAKSPIDAGIEPTSQANSDEAVRDELQPILRAVLGGSVAEQPALIQYLEIACANVDALGGPPRCPEGVPEGTVLEVFPMLSSEGAFATSEQMETILTNLLVKDLHAVYEVVPGPRDEPHFPVGEYAMLFESETNDVLLPVVLRVKDGKIVRIDYHVGSTPADLLNEIPAEQVVITPQEAGAWTEEVRGIPAQTP